MPPRFARKESAMDEDSEELNSAAICTSTVSANYSKSPDLKMWTTSAHLFLGLAARE